MKKPRIPDLTPAKKRVDQLSPRQGGTAARPAPRAPGIKPRATSAKSGRRGQ